MALSDWWYYTGSTTKALVIIGIAAMALLAIILASPYVKPLQAVTTRLGLMRTETVYVPIYVNHTVYVNRTIVKTVYINQTVPVPVYVNRTIYVPVPSNTSSTPFFNMGTCHLYSLVFNNGTVWTLGYWIPTPQGWSEIYNTTLIYWGRMNGTAGYQVTTEFAALFIAYPMEGYTAQLNLLANIPNNPPPGWVNMIYMGDWVGIGPVTVNSARIQGNTLVIPSTSSAPPLAIPFNTTVTVIIIPYAQVGIAPILIPCNWTVIKTPLTPQQALTLPAPMGAEIAYQTHYIFYGNNNYAPFGITWGWWVWDTKYPPLNTTNLPWPTS